MDFTLFFAKAVGRRKTNLIRHLTEAYMRSPQAISLAGGMPNTETFPFEKIAVTYKDGTQNDLVDKELATALQYGPSQGYLPLVKLWKERQKEMHKPLYDNWDLIVTTGAQDGCSKVFEMFIDEGQPVMTQSPLYPGTIGALRSLAPELIEINQDENGIIPEEIKQVCEERLAQNKPLPKLLYVNPTGANPTGTVLPNQRKLAVYNLAKKYNFLIVEDDAYYFLHFLDKRPTSFFSLDTDGRVIRLDSFSKILSSGLRLGIVTAHKTLIEKLGLHVQASNLHASSLSQMLVYNLLNSWSQEKFEQHIHKIQAFYRDRRDVLIGTLNKHLAGLAEWSCPDGGMFVWVKIPSLENTYDLAMKDCLEKGLFVLPGEAFNYDSTKPSQYIRLCYSYSTPDEVEKGIKILASALKKVNHQT